jgi:hypothetical protein
MLCEARAEMPERSFAPTPAALALALLCVSMPRSAAADDSDPPERAARLSYAEGQVALQAAGAQDWTAATLNRPITTGDKLWSDQSSRAELQLGSAAVRLAETTGFSLVNVDDRNLQMQVMAGTLEVSLPELGAEDHVEIDTPNLALSLLQPGQYRVEVNDSGDVTVIKVSAGEAQVTGAGQTFEVHPQESAAFTSTGGLTSDVSPLSAPDDFDQWCLARDQREESAQQLSGQYVSEDVTGYQDLDDYGSWQAVPDYGAVWIPTAVSVGWAPYRYGRWMWVGPWGWTWVGDEPWGFAPFHYGRWAFIAGSWCWVPGPRNAHPVYAPALVGWVGGSRSSPIMPAGGFAGVGWFPLAPHEAYVPAYAASERYLRAVNAANAATVSGAPRIGGDRIAGMVPHYANRTVPGTVTAVDASTFVSAQPVAAHQVHLSAGQLALTTASPLAPSLMPTRASIVGSASAPARGPPAMLQSRSIVARVPPPRAPIPLERQLEAIRANAGRPLSAAQTGPLRPGNAAVTFRPATAAPIRVRSSLPPTHFDEDSAAQDRDAASERTPAAPSSSLRTDRPPSAGGGLKEFVAAPDRSPPGPTLPARATPVPRAAAPPAHAHEAHTERAPPPREHSESGSAR